MGSIVKKITGADKAEKTARRRAEEAMRQQEAMQEKQEALLARQRQDADRREEELSAQAAVARRAVYQIRRGRASLAYTGSVKNGLKDKLGG